MSVLCFSDGQGHSYDLSPLAMDSRNWVVEPSTGDTDKQYYINVCRSLVQQGGPCAAKLEHQTQTVFPLVTVLLCSSSTGSWKCPSSAASCLKVGDEYVSLGQVQSGPTWDRGILKLQYSSGQACPHDGSRNRSSIIRLKCDKDKVVRETQRQPVYRFTNKTMKHPSIDTRTSGVDIY